MKDEELKKRQHRLIVDAGPDLRPIADAAWALEEQALQKRRFITLDLEKLSSPAVSEKLGDTLKWWISRITTSSNPQRFNLFAMASIAATAQFATWRAPKAHTRAISQKPHEDQFYRRCVRVLSMVHELHKAGYQRIRVLPATSPTGFSWRAYITFSENVADDGFTILDKSFKTVAYYPSGEEGGYFGWPDAKTLNARQLAEMFLIRFPSIAINGEGLDWAYAGWLTDVLGHAEAGPAEGGLINLLQEQDYPEYMRRWQPPPPLRK